MAAEGVAFGALRAEDRDAARRVIARDDIVKLKALARSIMPEGLEDLGEADLAALLQFLVDDAR